MAFAPGAAALLLAVVLAGPVPVPAAVSVSSESARADPNTWCPRFHTIFGHYDPSGPIEIDGVWLMCRPRVHHVQTHIKNLNKIK